MNSESTNSVSRRYSVKDTLTKHFPGDTITEMRASDADGVKENREDILPLAWAYADDMAIGHFLSEYFLVDTVLYDDYIAYFVKSRYGDEVFLSFMHFEDDLEFPLDPKYAYELIKAWEKKGYKARIMRNCVGIDNYPNSSRFRMVSHLSEDLGTDYLIPTLVNDKYIFVRAAEPFWKHADALLFSAITSGLTSEYESILAKDAVIARCPNRSAYDRANGKYEKAEPFVNGITAIKDYFDGKNNVFMAYVKKRKSIAYSSMLMSGNNKYIMFVGARNLLTQLVEEPLAGNEEFIPMPQEQMPSGEIMPDLVGIRSLDISTMHSYAIQLTFADGCVKNYYIANITEAELPESVAVDDYEFNQDVLNSVKLVCDHHREGVEFSNGYYIPAHILYYRGATQLVTEKIPGTAFENETLKIEGIYRVPLHIRRRVFCDTYQPRPGEYYGTGYTLLDENGNRTTDYSAFSIDGRGRSENEIICTRSESSSLVGYLKKDGSWMITPIFDEGNDFEYGHCVKAKIKDKKYLVNSLGEILPFDYELDTDDFDTDLCPFCAERYNGKVEFPEEEYFEDLHAGNWGYIDKFGRIVIEPQYIFATGFYMIEKGRDIIVIYLHVDKTTNDAGEIEFTVESYGGKDHKIEPWLLTEAMGKSILRFYPRKEMMDLIPRLIAAFNAKDLDALKVMCTKDVYLETYEREGGRSLNDGFYSHLSSIREQHGVMKMSYMRFNDVVFSAVPYIEGYAYFSFSANDENRIDSVQAHPLNDSYRELLIPDEIITYSPANEVPRIVSVDFLSPSDVCRYSLRVVFENGEIKRYNLDGDFGDKEVTNYQRKVMTDKIFANGRVVDHIPMPDWMGYRHYAERDQGIEFINGTSISALEIYYNGYPIEKFNYTGMNAFVRQSDYDETGFAVGHISNLDPQNPDYLFDKNTMTATVIPEKYQQTPVGIYPFYGGCSEGLVMVSEMGEVDLQYHHNRGPCAGLWGWLDTELNVVIEPKYVYAMNFWNGRAMVCKGEWSAQTTEDGKEQYWCENEQWGVIDRNENEIVPCRFDEIYEIDDTDRLYFVHEGGWKSGHYAIYDVKENAVILVLDFDFDMGYMFNECTVTDDNILVFDEHVPGEEKDLIYAYDLVGKAWIAHGDELTGRTLNGETRSVVHNSDRKESQ